MLTPRQIEPRTFISDVGETVNYYSPRILYGLFYRKNLKNHLPQIHRWQRGGNTMTDSQKSQIKEMRFRGMSYGQICDSLKLPASTVKSFCRRNEISFTKPPLQEGVGICLCCGAPVVQNPKRKTKKFCSDSCRMTWWNRNLDKVNRKAVYEFVCPYCKKPFTVYGNANRKYCSHECYIADRFGGENDD